MANDPLLQPFQLKHLTLKNRIMSTSHEPAYSEDGLPKDRYRLYHLERAKGGIALTMTAGSAIVSRDSPAPFGNLQLYRDEIVPWLKRLADDCHNEGCAVMIQVTHMGRRTGWNKADWLPVLGPSMVREAAHRAFPKEAEDWDLERIKNDFADAAERVKAAGLDGFELQCYGQLLEQFWSPGMNKRQDEHGGSLDNRLRFTFDVLKAIRKRIGPDFIIGLRLVTDEQWELGISKDEGLEIALRFKDSGLIDFLNVIRGRIDNDAVLSRIIPVTGMPSAPHLDYAGEIRAATKFPVFHAARIPDVATARHAIASGKLDMVGMTRALLTDPHIVRKIEAGIEDQIRPCVGATYCLDRIYEGGEALCIHNPASGREASMPHVIRPSRDPGLKVVVVGAGPAGLEAARVSGERGHRVVIFEASKEAGGQLRLAATGTRRRELIGIAEWRLAQLERLGVDLRFNRWAEAEDVLAERPDIVVVATGGLANQDCIDFGQELTVSSWDILSGDAKAGEEVLLFDDNGAHPGMQAAEKIALGGAKLEIVTPERNFAPEIGGLNHVPYQEVFQPRGVRLTTMRRLKGVKRSGNKLLATIGSDFGPWTEERLVDQVVVEHGTLPLADLYFTLRPLSINDGEVDYDALIAGKPQNLTRRPEVAFRLYRIGDAVASRNIHAAIYDALRLAKDF